MKLRPLFTIGNTKGQLMRLACGKFGITPLGAVLAIYPMSRQPAKKANGFYLHLRKLAREGYLIERPSTSKATAVFVLSPRGHQWAIAELNKARPVRQTRPVMRLVRDAASGGDHA